jgi:hypothetical protein
VGGLLIQKIKRGKRALYFTKKLKDLFNEFLEYPCTVVESPMGDVKTAAVKEALNSLYPHC